MDAPQQDKEVVDSYAPRHNFFLRRWMDALCNGIDKTFWGLTPGKDRTIANLTWWVMVVGGLFGLAMAILGDKHNYHVEGRGQINIQFVLAFVSATIMVVVYLLRSLHSFKSVPVKVLRSVFVVIWTYGAALLGYVLFWAVAIVIIIFLFMGFSNAVIFRDLLGSNPNSDPSVAGYNEGAVIDYGGKRYRNNGNPDNPWERI